MRDFRRQLDLFDPAKHSLPVTIVGAGGIGGPTALALAKMGIHQLKVYDHDTVDPHNQPNQIYGNDQIGWAKVGALQDIVNQLANVKIRCVQKKVTDNTKLEGVVIGAVDSMDARRAIWSAVRKAGRKVPLYVDGRIGGQVIRVLSLCPYKRSAAKSYEATLVSNDAVAPMRCTEAGIIDVSFVVAAVITRAVRLWCTDKEMISDLFFDQRNLRVLRS